MSIAYQILINIALNPVEMVVGREACIGKDFVSPLVSQLSRMVANGTLLLPVH